MAKRDSDWRTKVELNTDGMSVDVQIIEKESGEVVGTRSYGAASIHESVRNNVALYGYSKLLQDRASDTPVSPAKLDAMDAIAEQLAQGQWAKERKVGATVVSAEVEALARLKNVTVPQIQASLKAYDKAAKEKILSNPKVVALAQEIRKEREGAADVDLSDLE